MTRSMFAIAAHKDEVSERCMTALREEGDKRKASAK
jgi:hypothetical protein